MRSEVRPAFVGADLAALIVAPSDAKSSPTFRSGRVAVELEELLGAKVDLVTPGDLPVSFRSAVIAEAVAI